MASKISQNSARLIGLLSLPFVLASAGCAGSLSNTPNSGTSGSGSTGGRSNAGATYLYVAGTLLHGYRVDVNSAAVTELPGSPFALPAANIAASRNFVYASTVKLRDPSTILTAFRADPATGDLAEIGTTTIAATGNPGAAALVSDPSGHNLYAITGTPGDIVTFIINADGALATAGPRLHLPMGVFSLAISPNGRLAYVGIAAGNFKEGVQTQAIVALNRDPHSGVLTVGHQVNSVLDPSEMQFDSSGRYLLALVPAEQIYVFSVDYATGDLIAVPGSPFTSAGTDPAPSFTTTFRLDPSGKFVYALNNNPADPMPENISVFAFNQATGALASVQAFDLPPGTNPGSLLVDSTLTIAINSSSGPNPSNIDVVKRDQNTGMLSVGGNPVLVRGDFDLGAAVEVHF